MASPRVLSADWVLPVEGPPIRNGAIAIADGRIAALGPASELGEGERFEDAVILPGFVNAHTHVEYAMYAGFGDGLPFDEWLLVHIERKRRIDWEETVAIARAGAAEILRSGVTTVADASFTGAAAAACDELGLRAIVYLEVFGQDDAELASRFEPNRERIARHLSERVRLGVSPHAPYTCSRELYAACAALELPQVTHLAESKSEQDWLTHGTGAWEPLRAELTPPLGTTAIRHLGREGLLRPGLVAAHCVKVDEEEIGLLAEQGVAVAHCPRSNAVLGCGVAPLVELLAAGVTVGLGTDSPASTPSFDLFDELRAAIYAARSRAERADALRASRALELATLGSARALGLENEVGSLVTGKRADLTVVSLAGSPYLPWEDPAAAVAFGGSPERVELTLVDGEERYRKGVTDWHELRRSAADARARLLRREAPQPLRSVAPAR